MKLTHEGCRQRQKRLLTQMLALGIQDAVLGDPRHVTYLSGYETPPGQGSAVLLRSSGYCVLVAPGEAEAASDETVVIPPSELATLRLDHFRQVRDQVAKMIGKPSGVIGLDKGGASGYLGELAEGMADLSSTLFDLRRAKDPDELAVLREAVRVTEVCYARAREIVEPGVSEFDVYAELYRTAVKAAGVKLPALGNDFQCASPGGPPRNRAAQPGELYILDLGIVWGGYNSDMCRTFSVSGEISRAQESAWHRLVEVFSYVEEHIRPGVSCRNIYESVKETLDQEIPGGFFHHLGHGVGLQAHERPNLNPHWDQVFQEGDFFTVEPGLYSDELKGGIRLEENYLVTESGLRKVTSFPLDL